MAKGSNKIILNFAKMRNILGILLLVSLSACGTQKSAQTQTQQTGQTADTSKTIAPPPGFNNYAAGPPAGTDTVLISQPDESKLHIIGFGNMFISYTETMDGYSLIMNKQGIYEYATRGDGGDLVGSGVDARDPKDRSKTDEAFLANIPKHLRYDGKKLRDLLEKQHKWEESIYYGKQYRLYKEQQMKLQQEKQDQNKQPATQDNKKKQ